MPSFWQAVFVFVVEGLGADLRLKARAGGEEERERGTDCFSEDGLVAPSA
jgi:hypothetical protein